MNVLVIGKGGREHALVHALEVCPSVNHIYCWPGRSGFFSASSSSAQKKAQPLFSAEYLDKNSLSKAKELIPEIKRKNIELIIIGPEKQLVEGWADEFRSQGLKVFGPGKEASKLEGSKIFSKQFMLSAAIPTARFFITSSVSETIRRSKNFSPPYVLKADGLAAGKGVFICQDGKELLFHSKKLFEEKIFGDAGSKALLEEFQEGSEISIFILTNGKDYTVLPTAKDYKRRYNNEKGPNTGGMGAVAPVKIPQNLLDDIHQKILKPTVKHLERENLFYRGVVYLGLMITKNGPRVLEYNIRFGDPECQALLPLLEGDLGQVFHEIAQGRLPHVKFKNKYSCCVVLAENNYPRPPKAGGLITNSLQNQSAESYYLHAGVKKTSKGWLIDGGRVLNAVALDESLDSAVKKAYQMANAVQCPCLSYRTDIGSPLGRASMEETFFPCL